MHGRFASGLMQASVCKAHSDAYLADDDSSWQKGCPITQPTGRSDPTRGPESEADFSPTRTQRQDEEDESRAQQVGGSHHRLLEARRWRKLASRSGNDGACAGFSSTVQEFFKWH
jgi:hypothetical protein